jgi:signal peptidase II
LKVLIVTAVLVVIDQITKLLVKGFSIPFLNFKHEGMYHGQRVEIFGDFFRLTFIENPGMAFGIDPGLDLKFYLTLFSLLASVGLIIYLCRIRNEHFTTRLALAFILGGAIGNLIDRMFYGVFFSYAPLFHGKVVDFLDFNFFDITILGRSYDRFPIFNIADSAVTIGVFLLLIFYNKTQQKETEQAEELSPVNNEEFIAVNPADEISSGNINEHPDPLEDEKMKDSDDEPDNGKETSL